MFKWLTRLFGGRKDTKKIQKIKYLPSIIRGEDLRDENNPLAEMIVAKKPTTGRPTRRPLLTEEQIARMRDNHSRPTRVSRSHSLVRGRRSTPSYSSYDPTADTLLATTVATSVAVDSSSSCCDTSSSISSCDTGSSVDCGGSFDGGGGCDCGGGF